MKGNPTYFGHPVSIVRRGCKRTRIRFVSGRTKLVPSNTIRYPAQTAV